MSLSSCSFLLILLTLASTSTGRSPLHVVVFLPDNLFLGSQSKALLASGQQVVEEVNNCTDVLGSYSVELIPILTMESDIYNALIKFYDLLLSPDINLVGIVGQMDRLLAQLLSPITDRLGITQLVNLISDTNEGSYPNLYTPVPSLTLHSEAVVYLLLSQQWTRVGLLHTDSPTHLGAAHGFLFLVNQLHANVEITPILVSDSLNDTIGLMEDSQSFIFISFLPLPLSEQMISATLQRDLVYTWILLQYEPDSDVTVKDNNTLIIRYLYNTTNVSPHPVTCSVNNTAQDFVYRSLWTLFVALNSSTSAALSRSSDIPVMDSNLSELVRNELNASPFVQRYADKVQIADILWKGNETIGHFNSQTKMLLLSVNITVPGLRRNESHVYVIFSDELTRFSVSTVCLCYIFTSLLLLLFVCFRQEPEIKASSFVLSLLVFFGCYLVLSGALTLVVANGTFLVSYISRVARCNIELFCVAVGMDIILTTLLVKLLRVWRIFTLHGRTGRLWKDYSLFGFVLGVIGVKVVLLVIWLLVDPYNLEDVSRVLREDNSSVVFTTVQQCQSQYYLLWLGFIYGYSIIIALILIIVSVLTRKIQQDNFKDTKKISVFATSCAILAIVCGSLWTLLRFSNNSVGSKLSIGLMYCGLVLLSELFLFMPKILPPLLRQLHLAHAYEGKEIKFSSIRLPTVRPQSHTL